MFDFVVLISGTPYLFFSSNIWPTMVDSVVQISGTSYLIFFFSVASKFSAIMKLRFETPYLKKPKIPPRRQRGSSCAQV